MTTREVIMRAEAKERGLERYFTGKPCKHGHFAERRTKNGTCVECASLHSRTYLKQWHLANPHKSHEYHLNRLKEGYYKEYYARNREREIADYKKYRAANLGKARAASLRWYYQTRKNNPEKIRECSRRSRAKRESVPGRITASEAIEIFKAQRGRCAMCKVKLDDSNKHLDHIIPLSKGGHNIRSNAQYLCAPCNWSKHTKDPIDFAREKGFLL